MAKKSLFQYGSQHDYNVDAANRPSDSSTVCLVNNEVKYKGVNVVVEATPFNVEVGDMLVYDKQELKHKILKMRTYNAATFDTSRYVKSEALYHRTVGKVGLFLYKSQTSGAWGAQCEFKISGLDLTQSGSFDFLSTGYQAAATATTISWEAGATINDVKALFTTGNGGVIGNASYNSVTADNGDLIIMVGGYGTNNITISNLTGGGADAVLTDYSKTCKVGDVELTGNDNEIHRSFQGSTVATCFPSLAGDLLPVTSACYTVSKANRPYRCGMSFQIFKAYVTTNGATTFVDDTTGGSTFPMTKAKFDACATSETAAEVACYNRHNGDYDSYLRAAMIDIESLKGTVGDAYKNFGKQGKLLASIFYKNHNGEWKPCYPAAYNVSLMGVTAAGYTTGFEPGNIYMSESYEMASFMNDDIRLVLNQRIAALGGGNSLGGSNLWSASECLSSNAWVFNATYGNLHNGNKMHSYSCRGSLAFYFKS